MIDAMMDHVYETALANDLHFGEAHVDAPALRAGAVESTSASADAVESGRRLGLNGALCAAVPGLYRFRYGNAESFITGLGESRRGRPRETGA
jgi:hypothetical protein